MTNQGGGLIERALDAAKRNRTTQGHGPARRRNSASASSLDETGKHKAALQALPEFPRFKYDVERCQQQRILVPDINSRAKPVGDAAYRVLRTRLLQRLRSNGWSSAGVTSPMVGDGKSVTAINLALSIAREGNNNVFLIDLDMRKPKLCDYLGISPPKSIVDYLGGDGEPQDIFFSTDIPNLILAGTRTRTEDASELLAGLRVNAVFEYIHSVAHHPIIIVDLPPLLSTDDALVIAPRIDSFLLVLSVGQTKRDAAAEALDLISEFEIAGIVLNRSNTMIQEYYGP